ncbi:hypothetical protein B0A52_05489 [Exophiala mesophila]|uniref:Formamidopyrimidine-DNA glycosylase catalytic domain-containing protein n=1 Tax=Exophiala mesophila TaxID=212818 RepID=A0A438N3D8_EXOME|nr:hypothetical protein B0A52_05489 [Exophiala mesophila]
MPEIAEVARTVHFIRKHLVGKTIATAVAAEDANVFGKVGTSAAEFQKHMTGKKVVDAGQQGKYFWMIMSSPPHPVMHFGMSGWLKFKSEHTYYYRQKPGEEDEAWPPKFMKFTLTTKPEKGQDTIDAAFVDMRRFARVRLVDCPGDQIREYTPLKENGPDPVVDKDVVTVSWLTEKCRSKKVPIKAMLLDQANISGIGNWVGDEIMYHAKMHPEQYANTLSDEQIKQLHQSIHHICSTAVDLLADSDQFPDDWLFKHRWGKGKKGASNTMPSGEKILFLTVGGRTSAVVPSIQKKTGPVTKEMNEAVGDDEKPKKAKAKKRKADSEDDEQDEDIIKPQKTTPRTNKSTTKTTSEQPAQSAKPTKNSNQHQRTKVKEEEHLPKLNGASASGKPVTASGQKGRTLEEKVEKTKTTKRQKMTNGSSEKAPAIKDEAAEGTGRRRSGRLSKA